MALEWFGLVYLWVISPASMWLVGATSTRQRMDQSVKLSVCFEGPWLSLVAWFPSYCLPLLTESKQSEACLSVEVLMSFSSAFQKPYCALFQLSNLLLACGAPLSTIFISSKSQLFYFQAVWAPIWVSAVWASSPRCLGLEFRCCQHTC